jgi:tRNA G18 (ribose-2'-O)-methylase SpoU
MERKRNEVIVVATLIDKVPNLAGLSRTCEIMNAKMLVIPNKEVVKSEEFKGISVTSENWVPIIEVVEKDLMKYLEMEKSKGYKIVGLE